MVSYEVHVEAADTGMCMAHVLDLPGCFVRSSTRDGALDGLPQAIQNHWSWLRTHGESAPDSSETIELEVSAEFTGSGHQLDLSSPKVRWRKKRLCLSEASNHETHL